MNFGTDFLYLEDYPRAGEMLERVVELARAADAPGILSYALDQHSKLETRLANLSLAYALELESLQLTEPLGNDVALAASLAWLALVESMLGTQRGACSRRASTGDRRADERRLQRRSRPWRARPRCAGAGRRHGP